MEESDTYLAILDKGAANHARKAILRLAGKHLGAPSEAVRKRLQSLTDIDHLDRILEAAMSATSWEQLLQTP